MSIGQGEDLYDKLMRREQRKHSKDIEQNHIPRVKDKKIYSELGDEIIDSDTAIRMLKNKTGINNDEEIADSLNRLIENKSIVSSTGHHTNKVFLRKNPYIKPL